MPPGISSPLDEFTAIAPIVIISQSVKFVVSKSKTMLMDRVASEAMGTLLDEARLVETCVQNLGGDSIDFFHPKIFTKNISLKPTKDSNI